MKYTSAEIIDFIENKVQIDVKLLSAEEINKTTDIFGCAIEIIEKAELLQMELEKARDEAVKDFAHFLVDRAEGGSVDICNLPELVIEWGEGSVHTKPAASTKKEHDIKALLRIISSIKARLKRAREIPYIQRPTAWALYHVWREEDCKK